MPGTPDALPIIPGIQCAQPGIQETTFVVDSLTRQHFAHPGTQERQFVMEHLITSYHLTAQDLPITQLTVLSFQPLLLVARHATHNTSGFFSL